jgi:hypothetical protein
MACRDRRCSPISDDAAEAGADQARGMAEENGRDLGAKFWLGLIGICIAAGIGAGVALLLTGVAWYAWGFLGMILAVFVVFGTIGFVMDRRERRREQRLTA